MTYKTVIITPNTDIASSINHSYLRHDPDETVRAFSVWSVWHGRAERIIVLPVPKSYNEDRRQDFETSLRECVACRLIPGGEMIRL